MEQVTVEQRLLRDQHNRSTSREGFTTDSRATQSANHSKEKCTQGDRNDDVDPSSQSEHLKEEAI